MTSAANRLSRIDVSALETGIEARGYARVSDVLSGAECSTLIDMFGDDARFRSRIVMERHGFGQGEYGYFSEPLPAIVETLRARLYEILAPIANRMMARLGDATRYPETIEEFKSICQAEGQTKPTPLLLKYGAGGFNRLHQDRYGSVAFPLQATVLLSEPGEAFEGGAFMLIENQARQQSRGEAIMLSRGDLIIFPSFYRPVPGVRGYRRALMRHGVSTVERGERYTLGIIFHDAA